MPLKAEGAFLRRHLFDYFYQIGGSGFGVKKACAAPVHLLYSYPSQAQRECGDKECENDSDGHVWAVNSEYTDAASGMVATATVYALDGTVLQNQSQPLTEPLEADAARKLFALNLYPPPAPPPAPADADCVTVEDTDTVEDQYMMVDASSAKGCCDHCLKDDKCTHSVFSDGECCKRAILSRFVCHASRLANLGSVAVADLKNMKDNDHGNTMTPIRSEHCTLCLKRRTKRVASQLARTDAPNSTRRDATVLLRLRLTDAGGTVADENWYWLPPVLDKFDDPSSCFTGCKIDKFADMRDLSRMAAAPPLAVTDLGPMATAEGGVSHTIQLSAGEGGWLAFFVRLRALNSAGKDILPATWSDNFVSVLAGEEVEVRLGFEAGAEAVARVTAEAFNAPPTAGLGS